MNDFTKPPWPPSPDTAARIRELEAERDELRQRLAEATALAERAIAAQRQATLYRAAWEAGQAVAVHMRGCPQCMDRRNCMEYQRLSNLEARTGRAASCVEGHSRYG